MSWKSDKPRRLAAGRVRDPDLVGDDKMQKFDFSDSEDGSVRLDQSESDGECQANNAVQLDLSKFLVTESGALSSEAKNEADASEAENRSPRKRAKEVPKKGV